jgi:hypothetical protein
MRKVTISSIIGCSVEEWDSIPDWNWHILTAILDPHSLVKEHSTYNKTKEGSLEWSHLA